MEIFSEMVVWGKWAMLLYEVTTTILGLRIIPAVVKEERNCWPR